MKQKINMIGGGFQHSNCSSDNNIPKLIEWIKNTRNAPISIHINEAIFNIPIDKSKKNFAWLHESKTIKPKNYKWVKNNVKFIENNYILLFTHDESIASLSPKFKWIKWKGNPWVINKGIHDKTRLISMIASGKVMCEAHEYRQQILSKYKDKIDVYGRKINPIKNKEEGLIKYCFSITMENHIYPTSYSEKITDCFATGTVPIYYGTPTIGKVWNEKGIIKLDDNFKIDNLSFDLYYSMMPAIKDNYERVINMPVCEDYIFENYINPLI